MNDHSALGFADKILKDIYNYKLNVGKLRGSVYDIALVIVKFYNGIQTKIKAHCFHTKYFYNNDHRLKSVLNDIVTASVEIRNIFTVIRKLCLFYVK